MKSEIWDEKKAQKAKTIVQYLIDNVKNVSVLKLFHSPTNQKPISLPQAMKNNFCTHSHLTYPTWFLHPGHRSRDTTKLWTELTSLDPNSDVCISVFISVKMYLRKSDVEI